MARQSLKDIRVELAVGGVVFAIFLMLTAFTIFLAQENIFRRTYPVDVLFGEISTLRDGDKVVVRGMPVGKVKALELQRAGITVRCSLDVHVPIHTDYKVRIISTSMLGGKALQIDQGSEDLPLVPEGERLIGTDPTDLMEEAAEAVAKIRQALDEGQVLENVRQAVASVREIADKINSGEGLLGRLVNDKEIGDSFGALAVQVREVAGRIERQEGLLGKLLSADETLYGDFADTVASLKSVAGRLDRGEGTLGRLLSSDDTVYQDIADTTTSLKALAARLENGEGLLGKLMDPDETMYQDLRDTVAALKSTVEKIDQGEGTLGRLVNDDAVYKDVKAALEQLNAALDDYRETAPVVAFGSLILGAL